MRYLLALTLPPLALLLAGKPIQATINLILCITIISIPVCCVWAICVVASAEADRRNRALVSAVRRRR